MRRWQYSNLALLATLLAPALSFAATTPGAALREYLAARWRGDVTAAEKLWDSEDLRRAQGLGTIYAGLEARFDDNLLWTAAERQAAPANRPVVRDSTIEPTWARFTVLVQGAPADTLQYWVRKRVDEWRVTSPHALVTGAWTEREGRYFRLRASKLRLVNRDALQTLDTGMQRIMDELGTPELARLRLERLKLEYYLCDTDAELRSLGVRGRKSAYQLAGERVATRAPVDLNAAARMLVHLTYKEAPPRAAPWLEEGLPAALGGFGSASPDVVLQRGAVLVQTKGADPTSVFDARAMRSTKPETAVTLSAAWADALLRELGAERFGAVYRALSGSATQVEAMDAATVRGQLEKATGKRGAALVDWLRSSTAKVRAPIAGGCVTIPAETRSLKPVLRWRDAKEEWALETYETGDDYTFVITPYKGPMPAWAQKMMDSLATARGEKPAPQTERPRPPGDPPQIALLLRERLTLEAEAYESVLFHQHFVKRNYANELFGMIIRPDRVDLYDYRRDTLVGVHSPELATPGTPPYYDEKAGHLCFRMKRDLLPKKLDEFAGLVIVYTGE